MGGAPEAMGGGTAMTIRFPQAIIYDWDGTLVDTLPGLRLSHNHVRTSLGYPEWTEEEFRSNLKHSSRELYPRIYGDQAEKAMTILRDYIEANQLSHLNIQPNAPELLAFVAEQRIPQAVVSNKRHEGLVREINHLGWMKYFYCALGSGQAAKDKPAPDPILLALRKAEKYFEPPSIWFVGDTETDLLAAAAAGSPSVLITHKNDRSALIRDFKPYMVANDCEHLQSVIANMLQNGKQDLLKQPGLSKKAQ
jgi:phosphoglycolate phosphatase